MSYLESLKRRRSVYEINKSITISEETIIKTIEEVTLLTPSAYNSQSQRVVILLKEKHDYLWELVKSEIKKLVSEKDFANSEAKINGFKNGYGTVLFFDDEETTKALTEKFPLYKDNFLKWAVEQNGMLQVNVWNALADLGIGASLQHYNELIEAGIKKALDIPKAWKLNAQMPFGNIVNQPEDKEKFAINKRVKIFK
jgi:predicted oxidoreductase (fatty acid repression mutant protein)